MAKRKKKLPVAAMIVAIVNLILFVPCMCCSGGGLVVAPLMGDGAGFAATPQQKEDIKKTTEQMEQELPNAKTIGIVFNVANLACSIMMVVAAIGLLMRKPWGRLLCIAGAALLILIGLANLVYQATNTLPVQLRIQEEQMRKQNAAAAPPKGFMQGVGYGTLVFMALFMIGYPVLALGLMMSSPVRNFYSGRTRDPIDDDDDLDRREDDLDDDRRGEDDDYDRPRRRDDY